MIKSHEELPYIWQAKSQKILDAEDKRQIQENITSFFEILMEWKTKERDSNVH